uniref:Uncharacterized protein n=1 Tax=Fagus sylvatica TaxID=28930 RepID=A0A2N9H454_FAGSY
MQSLGTMSRRKVPSLKQFMTKVNSAQEYDIPSLAALASAMLLLQWYEFKNNHGEWVSTVKPDLGLWVSLWEALRTTDENVDVCHSAVKTMCCLMLFFSNGLTPLKGALDFGVHAIPTVPWPPPKLHSDPTPLEAFRAKACLLTIARVSGFCQTFEKPDKFVSAYLQLAKYGSDGFLLNLVEILYDTLQEEVGFAEKKGY